MLTSCGRPNNSFNPTGISLAFIVNLPHDAVASRRVNSSVRHASQKQDSTGLGDEAQKTKTQLNDSINARSNKRFDRSGMSTAFIRQIEGLVRFFPPR
jgi:Leucine-rich repeat (LRR) protein